MIYTFDDFELDPDKLELRRAGRPVKADALSLRLLAALLREAGQLVSKRELIERVWEDRAVSDNVITVAMVRLRKALGHKPGEHDVVVNLHGRGYRFVRPVTQRTGALEPVLAPQARREEKGQPFVGRTGELGQLREALAAARTGRGSVSILRGEAGIGKTSALALLAREAEATGMLVAWGHCHESGDTPPLWPFSQLARDVIVRSTQAGAAAQLEPAVQQLLQLMPDLALLLGDAPTHSQRESPLDFDGAAKYRVFDAFARLFSAAAEQSPCLLLLDDLHRADAASLELLPFWIDRAQRARVLLIGTVRTRDDATRGADARLRQTLGQRKYHELSLERLGEAAVAEYVASQLADPTDQLSRAIHDKSAGNPFFMVELVRQLRHAGQAAPELLTMPAGALALVEQRVRSLDDASRGVLSSAAVIGRSFDLTVLCAVTGHDLQSLMTSLDRALENDVLVAARGSKTSFTFSHELLREALYGALPAAQRRALHLRVASALEHEQRAGGPVRAAELAFHLNAALPDGDLRKTVSVCGHAADAAAQLHAYADAMRYLRHSREALALTGQPSPRLRLSLLVREALCARVCSSHHFEPLVRELLGCARELRAGVALAHGAMLLSPHPGLPGFVGSCDALSEALTMLPAEDDENRAVVLARLCTVGPTSYDHEAASLQLKRALDLAQSADTQFAHYNTRMAQLYLCGGADRPEQVWEARDILLALASRAPIRLALVPILLDLDSAIRRAQAGDEQAVDSALERAAETSRRVHSRELLWHIQRYQLLARVNRGEESEAHTALRALHAEAAQEGILGSQLLSIHDQLVILGQELPRSLLRSALASSVDDPPSVWSLKLRTLAAAGMHDELRVGLSRVPPGQLARLPHDRDYLGTLGALARSALALRALDYAEALCPLLGQYPAALAIHSSFLCEGSTPQLLGELLLSLGRAEHGRQQLRAGLAISEQAGLLRAARLARQELESAEKGR